MKSLIIASSMAIATLACGAAMAAPPAATAPTHAAASAKANKEHTSTGVVQSYSASTHRLMLKSGLGYTVDAKVTPANFKKGDKVEIRWKAEGKIRDADQVTLKN